MGETISGTRESDVFQRVRIREPALGGNRRAIVAIIRHEKGLVFAGYCAKMKLRSGMQPPFAQMAESGCVSYFIHNIMIRR
jgi:hypothetical protein